MRLIGATSHQINVIASVDAIVSALIGAIFGSLVFMAARPLIANIAFSGAKFFPNIVNPTIWGYIILIAGVPIIAAVASLFSLRRVQISPLGVSRKTTPPKPRAWRLLPLIAGIFLFPYAASNIKGNSSGNPGPFFLGFILILVGIVLSGSWLTMQATNVLANRVRKAPSLLAARRLSDNPRAAFRSISGLVLAVFIGSFISVLIPGINQAQNPSGEDSLSNVLRVPFNFSPLGIGLPPKDGSVLINKMKTYPGTVVMPIYTNPAFATFQQQQMALQGDGSGKNGEQVMSNPNTPPPNPPADSITSCVSVGQMKALGSCPSDAQAVTFTAQNILNGDNPLEIYKNLPIITPSNQVSSAKLSTLSSYRKKRVGF